VFVKASDRLGDHLERSFWLKAIDSRRSAESVAAAAVKRGGDYRPARDGGGLARGASRFVRTGASTTESIR